MVEYTPADSRYIPLTQQPWCCVPTCIQMVMLKESIPLIAAETIAHKMGLVVPEEQANFFWKAPIAKKPSSGWGTQLGSTVDPNVSLEELGIPLRLNWFLADKMNDPSELKNILEVTENVDGHALLCFDWGTLHKKDAQGGHVVVFDKIVDNSIRYIDTETNVPKWRYCEIERMHEAIAKHGKDNQGGVWIVEKVKNLKDIFGDGLKYQKNIRKEWK